MGAVHQGGTRAARRLGGSGRGPAVLLVIAALAAACGNQAPTPTPPGGSPGPASPSPSAGTAATPSPLPSAATGAWSPVTLADVPPVARLEPTASGAGGMSTTTAFRLTSLDGTKPADLVARLRVDPPVQLAVAELDGPAAVLRPESALRPATLYRFSLLGADGTIAGAWAAQTAGPLRIVETIPGDEATEVPLDAGIELVFDQPGVSASDLGQHLSITPSTPGHIEVAGRQLAFVPATPLAKATLYTVRIAKGLPLAGTDQRLDQDQTFRFETEGRSPTKVSVGPMRDFLESTPRDAAAIALWVNSDNGGPPPARIPVTVHRLAGLAEAEDAWRHVTGTPAWAQAVGAPAVDTTGLPRVVAARVPVRGSDGEWWIRLPRALPAGWYAVTIAVGHDPRQAILQVTDLATYALVTTSRSAVWINDLRTDDPLAAVAVKLGGRALGSTDSRGVLVAATPQVFDGLASDDRSRLLEVRHGGSAAFQPVRLEGCPSCSEDQDPGTFWHVLTSDRYRYRSNDTVNAWGVVRDRATGRVPSSLNVRLLAEQSDTTGAPPISELTATPDANGAFALTVPLRDLPGGSYRLDVRAGSRRVAELWFEVGTITKPAFRLAVTPDRLAVIAGDRITVAVHGSFFEGTPVSGLPLTVSRDDAIGSNVTTDANGDGSASFTMPPPQDAQWTVMGVQATPTQPEEAAITASTSVVVFAGDRLIDTSGHVAAHRLTITGRVNAVDLSKFNGVDQAALYEVDARGAPVAGATVKIRVIEHRLVRRRIGTSYDFVLKRVIPRYSEREAQRVVGTTTVVTGADGRFRTTLPVTGGDRQYEIVTTTVDDGHRSVVGGANADERSSVYEDTNPRLASTTSQDGTYSVGDPVAVRFEGGIRQQTADRYLFATLQEGLRAVRIQGGARFRTTFDETAVPAIELLGVRFTGIGYEETYAYTAALDVADRTLSVGVSADRGAYAPGDTAHLTVSTRDAAGRPVSASVFVQAVDEKLFATGDASLFNPIWTLYASLSDGVLAQVRSHQTPNDDFGDGKGGGDTTGGGDGRSDFRDWLLGSLIRTDATGTATLDVPLSDDLTSWHVTAEAVDGKLEAGAGEHLLPVSLPLFAEATIPATLLVTDKPVIRVRAFGGGLHAGDPVTITVSSDSLGMPPVTRQVPAFGAVEVPLPALKAGEQTIRVGATAGGQHDALVRTVQVLPSRAERDVTTWAPLVDRASVQAGTGLTHLVLVDGGRGRVVPVLEELAGSGTARSDQAIAAGVANRTLAGVFGLPATPANAEPDLSPFVFEDSYLSVVPWGSDDLDATALAAMAADPRLDPAVLRDGLQATFNSPEETRERRLLALAGLAGLGDPVLGDVRAAATVTDLTVPEQVSLALAALYAGDEDLARTLEHRVLTQHGVHLGPWTKLDSRSGEDPDLQTARLAIVAASLGEGVAAEMDAWIADNPPRTTSIALERALAARGWALRVPPATGVAALTVDGARREVTVGQGASAAVDLTPDQAASASVEPVSGTVIVALTRSVPLGDAGLTPPAGLTLERQVQPAGTIGETDTVRVSFNVKLGPSAGDGCWRLTDLAPSGLAPVGLGWQNDEGVVVGPDRIDGQRVEFCLAADPQHPTQVVSYLARVVDPGTYAWEPAVLQSTLVPDQGVITPASSVTITPAGG